MGVDSAERMVGSAGGVGPIAAVRAWFRLYWPLFAVQKWPTARAESGLASKTCWLQETSRSPICCASPRPRFPRAETADLHHP